MIFRSLKAKDPETGFASLASLETEHKKSYGGRGGESWSRMTLFSFFLFLHELFLGKSKNILLELLGVHFFFIGVFLSGIYIHTK